MVVVAAVVVRAAPVTIAVVVVGGDGGGGAGGISSSSSISNSSSSNSSSFSISSSSNRLRDSPRIVMGGNSQKTCSSPCSLPNYDYLTIAFPAMTRRSKASSTVLRHVCAC